MHILIFSQHFWPEEFRINDLTKDLLEQGITVSVLTGKPNYPNGVIYKGYKAAGFIVENFHGINIYRVPMLPRGQSGTVGLIINYLSFLISSLFFSCFLTRNLKIDSIFVYGTSPLIQGLSAIPLKYFHRARLITWVQDLWPDDLFNTGYIKNRLILKLNGYLATILYKFTDKILIQSEGFRPSIQKLSTNRNIFLLPNPIERSVFELNSKPLPSHLSFLESGFNIVFAGNIGNNQAIETIICAAEGLKSMTEIKIIIVGDGSRSAYLESEIISKNLDNIIAIGRYPSEIMPSIYRKASALLVTLAKKGSLSQTIPGRVQAYLAAGIPIVGAVDGQAALTINSAGAGIVCPAESVNGLIECIKRLYEMSDSERLEMGRRGRAFAETNYHPEKIAKALIGFCTEESPSQKACI